MPMPMFAAETARPIMQYVRELEGKVLMLRAERRRFQGSIFLFGIVFGGIVMFLVLRYLH